MLGIKRYQVVRRLPFPTYPRTVTHPGNRALVHHWEDHMGDRRQATASKPTLAALAMP